MKKIPISNFRKKFDDASFQVVKKCINKRSEHGTQTINISKIIDEINLFRIYKKNLIYNIMIKKLNQNIY